nr:hypothetical protein [uncultured Sphingomonas sp.]
MDISESLELGLRRSAEMAAMFMIGDGLLGLLQPRRHVALWRSNVPGVDLLVRPFAAHPHRRRAYGALQIVAGIALASALKPRNLP